MTGEVTDRALNEFYPDPQQVEPVPIMFCAECNEEIYEGNYYWNIDGEHYCEDCADKLFRYEATRD